MALGKRGLGRGLDSLIPGYDESITAEASGAVELKITEVEPNSTQPRRRFDKEKLRELADSIAIHGVIQPILVVKAGARYQIIAGERRWRAAKLAGLATIPSIVRDYDELKVFEVALIENLQREDLNPVEEALGYKALMEKFSMTQEQISQRVSKSRSGIANALRIISLPKDVLALIESGALSPGHAKVLLSLPHARQQSDAAAETIAKKMSVRELERHVKALLSPPKKQERPDDQLRSHITALEEAASRSVGSKVKIRHGKGKGKIEIQYYSNEDLERILEFFKI